MGSLLRWVAGRLLSIDPVTFDHEALAKRRESIQRGERRGTQRYAEEAKFASRELGPRCLGTNQERLRDSLRSLRLRVEAVDPAVLARRASPTQ
jgi:hypothetical protein